MPGVPQLYLDTNVFILLGESFGDIQQHLVALIAAQPGGESPRLATSELTLAELLAKPYADSRDELIDQYDGWMLTGSWLQVGHVTRDVLRYAAVLRSRYKSLKLPDAIHLSTAFGFGCKYFLTADTHFGGSYSIVHTRYGLSRFSPESTLSDPSRTRSGR